MVIEKSIISRVSISAAIELQPLSRAEVKSPVTRDWHSTFVLFDDTDHTIKTASCGFGANDRTAMLRMCGIGNCVMADH